MGGRVRGKAQRSETRKELACWPCDVRTQDTRRAEPCSVCTARQGCLGWEVLGLIFIPCSILMRFSGGEVFCHPIAQGPSCWIRWSIRLLAWVRPLPPGRLSALHAPLKPG